MNEQKYRNLLSDKKKIIIKIGTSSLHYSETGNLNFIKLEQLVRELCNIRNQGKDVVLVTSGAIAVGRKALGIMDRPQKISTKQACAAVGQAKLMTTYQKLFAEYNQSTGQVLMTKKTVMDNLARKNAQNTFEELFRLQAIPIVNENDTVSTYEMQFGDNDTLSAIVASLVGADLLILLSDIDGLYTDDPNVNPDAKFVGMVEKIDQHFIDMGKGTTGTTDGTGGMATKINAAKIATYSGADMVIANGKDVSIIHKILDGEKCGTLFKENIKDGFYISDYIEEHIY